MASMGGASANRAQSVSAPDKGSFPLDHFNECKAAMEKYLACMKKNENAHALCRDETKAYLDCRMQKGLMAKEKLDNFGLNTPINYEASVDAEKEHVDYRGRKG
eukprot:CAMPEP_0181325064 /NCGR_PEP_ID=MMETSP1101-20121128/20711_1 /TAXON_ID=46948 /ORGANISM="Rhodomonas abbreviata, Strain Caron Lab Isolate" /LENGTH=103 /DNA_ID=CAMNT_0023433317 /DNA_START=74 /DNA_END=382 /DNA_ORIENTATION=+